MGWATGLIVFVVIWWLVIFLVLAWGRSSIDRDDAGAKSGLRKKLAITTVLTSVLWGIVYFVIGSGMISFRQ